MHDRPDSAFMQSVEPYRGALRLHCYRMLGSSHDGDDMVQETMLRAWRSRDSLSEQARLRPWLYRIATNVCLDELERRPKRLLVQDTCPPAEDPCAAFPPPLEEAHWLEPMPDAWLETAGSSDPSARYELKESVALAFVAALQILTPPQRATLLLRDVVGLSAEETAGALGMSVSAANSALFRARTTVEEKLGGRNARSFAPAVSDVDQALLARYVRAFEAMDMDALVSLFHDDIETTMPPIPMWIRGRGPNEAFYRHMFGKTPPGWYSHARTRANAQLALGFYRPDQPGGIRTLRAIQLVAMRDGLLHKIEHFITPAVFPLFDLPKTA